MESADRSFGKWSADSVHCEFGADAAPVRQGFVQHLAKIAKVCENTKLRPQFLQKERSAWSRKIISCH
ncbi:hypothetical protein BN873_890149 [Candidatus Competibacter denitrificans Run_A_D11]|uniref:Uncharacterized protein n=1 Tax=Candidatus Competibacter denitrificans Run_A_D11 TaxID=1400863 RepID=W6ME99_9GAMM|nr:hypothetical protein BN873_890149 [Candidatus Competibacter denitrificans Run_A_D11]